MLHAFASSSSSSTSSCSGRVSGRCRSGVGSVGGGIEARKWLLLLMLLLWLMLMMMLLELELVLLLMGQTGMILRLRVHLGASTQLVQRRRSRRRMGVCVLRLEVLGEMGVAREFLGTQLAHEHLLARVNALVHDQIRRVEEATRTVGTLMDKKAHENQRGTNVS